MSSFIIEIDSLRCRAFHGVMPQERTVGNTFEVTARLRYPALEAARTDDLNATLNYALATRLILDEMARPSALLESVCLRIKEALCTRFPLIEGGSIKVAKLNPPIPASQVGCVAATLSW